MLCSPSCALRHFDVSYTPPYGWDCDEEDDRRIVVLVHDQIAGFRMSSNHHHPQRKWIAR